MLNFSVGPVQMDESILSIGAEQVPYFRTSEFSAIMQENERLILSFCNAPSDCRCVFLTGSGTASMEAAVSNLLSKEDKVLVVDGGSFGHRFVQLCQIFEIPYEAISLEPGCPLTAEKLEPYADGGYTAFLVNLNETSTGVLYDLDLISEFCAERGIFLLVDSISAFLAESIDFEKHKIGAMLIGSQKALAVPPGLSIIVLSAEAQDRVVRASPRSLYFNLAMALKDGERGQTPFTPAVGILIQLNARLRQIDFIGVEAETARIAAQAQDFRKKIANLPLTVFTESLGNTVTPLKVSDFSSAKDIFNALKDEYGIWVCPNGGSLAEKVFRVGHIGNLTFSDNDVLVSAMDDLVKKGILR